MSKKIVHPNYKRTIAELSTSRKNGLIRVHYLDLEFCETNLKISKGLIIFWKRGDTQKKFVFIEIVTALKSTPEKDLPHCDTDMHRKLVFSALEGHTKKKLISAM